LMECGGAGVDQFREEWRQYDWLRGRRVTVETAQRQQSGTAVGVADDGALLIDTGTCGAQRISSGTVTAADVAERIA